MAHIASCMTSLEPSPSPMSYSPAAMLSETPPPLPEKPYAWRMQSETQRKYQLFPKPRQSPSPSNTNVSVDPETAFALAMNKNIEKLEKAPPAPTPAPAPVPVPAVTLPAAAAPSPSPSPVPASAPAPTLKMRMNQSNGPRRRKMSISELGPMTTVHEVPMDSPTIPGCPPLRERSNTPSEDEAKDERSASPLANLPTLSNAVYTQTKPLEVKRKPVGSPATAHRAGSPKQLAPLVIPEPKTKQPVPELRRPPPFAHARSDSTPPLGTSQAPRFESSPLRPRLTPTASTPELSGGLLSANIDNPSAAALTTPVSAPIMESRLAPKQWDTYYQLPLSAAKADDHAHNYGHRRFASESSSNIDREKPRGRPETRNTNSPQPSLTEAKRSKSSERRAFEELPQGWKPSEAVGQISGHDIATLQKQAFGQAERFEVLRVEDVEALSKELRQLDERTEYIRRTYNSLRAGRRNLHSRICQYLRSPRVARFNHESMLKQEEALAELDSTIDEWVIKLERAENRRTRVRQKLLEHVAAAAILSVNSVEPPPPLVPSRPQDISTPPRSPSKPTFTSRAGSTSPSPQRVVAQVSSTILELPSVEEVDEDMLSRKSTMKRSNCESIRIYAGDELFALLTDVEDEINRMSSDTPDQEKDLQPQTERTEIERQRSHEKLSGLPESPSVTLPQLKTSTPRPTITNPSFKRPSSSLPIFVDLFANVPLSPPAPTPPMKDPPKEVEIFLTSAVFKPN